MKTRPDKVNVITLGCARNLVDSEVLMAQLKMSGCEVVHNSDDVHADTVIINTCGFIQAAREESVDMILRAGLARKEGTIGNLIVTGCMSQRYKEELRKVLPEVDGFYGIADTASIVEDLGGKFRKELVGERLLTTPSHYAYLKISEGCDRTCSFCAIPMIRGRQLSRPIEEIVREAGKLASGGVREIILIAQDLTAYGRDLYRTSMLPRLLVELEKVPGIDWIRLHYAYPASFPSELLDIMASSVKICRYLDIPFQHISDGILSRMKRGISGKDIRLLIAGIRETVPGIALRTSLMVGYPGESETEFRQLMDFVATEKFERLGVFTYSEEEGTSAAKNEIDMIPQRTKENRRSGLMKLQSGISLGINRSRIGSTIPVLIDRKEGDKLIGRTEFDSPEVDNEVIINTGKSGHDAGEMLLIRIDDADEYDLYGTPVD